MMKMSEHFSVQELTQSSTALRLGIDNTPTQQVLLNLSNLMDGLEGIRLMLGKPIHINSGYRCPALNKAVGGAANSAHMAGNAADFVCPEFGTPAQIVLFLQTTPLKWDNLIQEGHWVHISFDSRMRQQVLTAHFDTEGKATYTQGAA
jgi:hypothetical protein